MKKYFLVYKIVNNINGKYYIGVHKTSNKNDGYMGSGKSIIAAEQKYGIENFTKTILFECSSEKEMFEKEKEIVNESVVNDRMSYNMKIGGTANFYYINNNGLNHSKNQHKLHAKRLKSDLSYAKKFSEKMKIANKKSINKRKEKAKGRKWINNPVTHENKFASKETYNKLIPLGWKFGYDTKNSKSFGKGCCGRMWIRNPKTFESKFIKKTDPIPEGWEKGKFQHK